MIVISQGSGSWFHELLPTDIDAPLHGRNQCSFDFLSLSKGIQLYVGIVAFNSDGNGSRHTSPTDYRIESVIHSMILSSYGLAVWGSVSVKHGRLSFI